MHFSSMQPGPVVAASCITDRHRCASDTAPLTGNYATRFERFTYRFHRENATVALLTSQCSRLLFVENQNRDRVRNISRAQHRNVKLDLELKTDERSRFLDDYCDSRWNCFSRSLFLIQQSNEAGRTESGWISRVSISREKVAVALSSSRVNGLRKVREVGAFLDRKSAKQFRGSKDHVPCSTRAQSPTRRQIYTAIFSFYRIFVSEICIQSKRDRSFYYIEFYHDF